MKREMQSDDGDYIRLRPAASDKAAKSANTPAQDKAEPQAETGTALVPYDDVARFGFRDLRPRKKPTPQLIDWPLRLIRTALFMVAFIAFAGGLYDQVSWGAHKLFGAQVQGVVVKLDAAASGLAAPTVEYALPLDGGQWQAASRLPRGDLALGDEVAVSVIPGSEGLTRIERSSYWRAVSLAALVGGAVAMWLLASVWPAIERILGVRRREESPATAHTRTLASLMIAMVLVGVAWMKFVYTPWLGVSEFRYLITAPDQALLSAGQRCGEVGDGPLNACELRVLGLPGLGRTAAEGAYQTALLDGEFTRIARYHAAIANPEIDFSIDWASTAPFLLNTTPEVMLGLLATGAAPPAGIAAELVSAAEARGWMDVAAALRKSAPKPGG